MVDIQIVFSQHFTDKSFVQHRSNIQNNVHFTEPRIIGKENIKSSNFWQNPTPIQLYKMQLKVNNQLRVEHLH